MLAVRLMWVATKEGEFHPVAAVAAIDPVRC